MVRALRGAITAEKNDKEEILGAAEELVKSIMEANGIGADDMIDIIFTVTDDITAAFPAAGVRRMGISSVPLLDMAAPSIEGALSMCIRVMIHIETDKPVSELKHMYLKGAAVLRPDISGMERGTQR